MQKRVHFAPTNTVFSPSRSPSPALSEASSPSDSSSEVSTPPPEVDYDPAAHYPRSPFPHSSDLVLHPAPYPVHQSQQVQYTPPQAFFQPQQEVVPKPSPESSSPYMHIHLLLAFHPETDLPLQFDISTGAIGSYVLMQDLAAPATEPHLPSLIITCPHLAWEIHVAPQPEEQRDYVTVNDILRCLHRGLRHVVTPEEYDALATGPVRAAVDAAYHARCARIENPQKRARDEKYGIRRIDFLQGANLFKGLSGTLAGPNIWELNVAALSTPLLPVIATPSIASSV